MGKSKKDKDIKTNAMRFLDSKKIAYTVNTYECEDFVDGVHIAQMLGQDEKMSYKTLVTRGKSGGYFVFVLPVAQELDMKKAAKAVGEKSVEMLHVKDINAVTGYLRGGCSPLGAKKDYPVYMDDTCRMFDRIAISAGLRGMQILAAPEDLARATGAVVDTLIM